MADAERGLDDLKRELAETRRELEGLREESAYARLLERVAVAANSASSSSELFSTCLELVCAHTGWPVGHVYAPADDDSGELAPSPIWHLEDPTRFEIFRRVTEATRFAPGIGLPGRVLASGGPAWIPDVTRDPNFPRARQARDIGVRAAFGFPVLVGREVAAVLEFFSTRAIDLRERMLEVMGNIGTQLGRVIERERASDALRESRQRYQTIFESAPVSIWEEDLSGVWAALAELKAQGVSDFRSYLDEHPEFVKKCQRLVKVLDVNAASVKMTGARSKEQLLVGLDVLGGGGPIELFKEELIAIAEGRKHFQAESRNRTRSGDRLDTQVSLAIPSESSEFRSLLVCLVDITERKRAEEERRRLESQLRHTQKLESLAALSGGIAHDFNNLLTGILANAGTARRELPEGHAAQRHLAEIVQGSKIAAHLIGQLLAYAGRRSFDVRPLDVSAEVRGIEPLLSTAARGRARISFRLAEQPPAIVADPTQLQQVLLNLVINAAESGGGEVAIRVATGEAKLGAAELAGLAPGSSLREGHHVLLEVSDDGAGMDEETQARVFEPFFSSKATGRGLGLAATLGIVNGHGGGIAVDSAPGAGSSFRVYFPVSQEPVAGAQPPAEQELAGRGTVLVVDDDEYVLEAVYFALRGFGYSVLLAESGRAALELFRPRAAGIDLVILDLTMPDMSGRETASALREIRPDLKVLLSTGYDADEAAEHSDFGPIEGLLHKPYEPEQLASAVKAAIGQPAGEAPELEADLAPVRASYRRRLPERLAELERDLAGARGAADREALVAARRVAHTLAGTSGSYGFGPLAEEVASIDAFLRQLLEDAGEPAAIWEGIDAALARARAALP